MKKLLIIAITLVSLYSCTKTETATVEPAYCWKCNTFKTVVGIGLDLANPVVSNKCSMTQAQIDKYVSDNTIKDITGAVTKTTQLTSCTKQ